MRSTGLEAVTNAAALFAPSTQDPSLQTDSEGSGRLLGTAIAVIKEGARSLPIEVQALCSPRVHVVTTDSGPVTVSDAVDESSEGDESSYDMMSNLDESSDDVDDGDGDESSVVGSSIFGAGLMRGADKFIAAEAEVSPKEILPMVRHVVGLQDNRRMSMLLTILGEFTPIKVRGAHHSFFGGGETQGLLPRVKPA